MKKTGLLLLALLSVFQTYRAILKYKSLNKKSEEIEVYVSEHGTKYHISKECRGLKNSKVSKITKKNALSKGYSLCKLEKDE